jgi:hypothetical protein
MQLVYIYYFMYLREHVMKVKLKKKNETKQAPARPYARIVVTRHGSQGRRRPLLRPATATPQAGRPDAHISCASAAAASAEHHSPAPADHHLTVCSLPLRLRRGAVCPARRRPLRGFVLF